MYLCVLTWGSVLVQLIRSYRWLAMPCACKQYAHYTIEYHRKICCPNQKDNAPQKSHSVELLVQCSSDSDSRGLKYVTLTRHSSCFVRSTLQKACPIVSDASCVKDGPNCPKEQMVAVATINENKRHCCLIYFICACTFPLWKNRSWKSFPTRTVCSLLP